MPWFNVDDGFANSKPVMRIPRRYRAVCIGVWTLCGSWSAKELTDGFIPQEVVSEYGGTPKIVALLVAAELWQNSESGVQFRNWAKWQKTKQQVLDYRQAEADRKRNRRNAKRQTSDQQEPEMSAECPAGTHNGHPVGRHAESGIPIPKPEPTPIPTVVTNGGEQTSVAPPAAPALNPDGTTRSVPDLNEAPPKFCPRHQPAGTLNPCGPCKQARITYDTWYSKQTETRRKEIEAEAAEIAAARRQAAATRQNRIDTCTLCDDDGYINGATVCDHIDRTQTVANGMAAIRAALGTPHQLDDERRPHTT